MKYRLKELRQKFGMTQEDLATKIGASKSHVSEMESGKKHPSAPMITRIADAFGVDPSDMIDTGSALAMPSQDGEALVPVYNVQASAGPGALVGYEEVVDRLAFPAGYLRHVTKSHPKNLQIIGVKGDSMQNTLKDDDLVMIDTSKTDLSFEGLFVIKIDGGAALLVKRIGRSSIKGHIKVISDNPAHPAVDILAEDVTPVGKVVWAGVKI